MKKSIKILLFAIILTAADCQKTTPCHKSIFVTNNSQEAVIIALRFIEGSTGLCKLNGNTYSSGEVFEYNLVKTCWEDELGGVRNHFVYVIDPNNFNDPDKFYPCDSINKKNTILKKYELTLEELQANNFRINHSKP